MSAFIAWTSHLLVDRVFLQPQARISVRAFFVSFGWGFLLYPISAFAISYKRKKCQTKTFILIPPT